MLRTIGSSVDRIWLLFKNSAIGTKTRLLQQNVMKQLNIDNNLTPIDFENKDVQLNTDYNTTAIFRKHFPVVCAESSTVST